MNAHDSTDIPDPTDFPPFHLAPGLRDLDGSFRCNICGELYDAPVTLSCGHCFCSLCIRSALSVKQECPTCRKTAMDGHIRPNPAVGEVVSAWKLSRPYVLKLSRENERRNSASSATPTPKRRKITPELGNRSGNSSSSSSATHRALPSKGKRKRQTSEDLSDVTIPTSEADEDESLQDHSVKMVDCPLCNKRVRFDFINQHLDSACKEEGTSSNRATAGWKKLMAPVGKGKQKETNDDEENHRLPKVTYATLKDKQLKEMLAEQGLPTIGDRQQCINRHHRWVMLFNANLDRSSDVRKSRPELRKELKKWEEEKAKKKKTVVDDVVAYEKRNNNEFKQLIDAARASSSSGSGRKMSLAESSNVGACSPHGTQGNNMRPRGVEAENAIVVDSEGEQEMGVGPLADRGMG